MWLFSPSRMALENAKYFSSFKHAARSAPSCHRPSFSAFFPVKCMNGVKGGRVSQGSRVNLLPPWLSRRGQKQMQKCFLCAKVTLTDDQIRLVRLNWGTARNPLILRLLWCNISRAVGSTKQEMECFALSCSDPISGALHMLHVGNSWEKHSGFWTRKDTRKSCVFVVIKSCPNLWEVFLKYKCLVFQLKS